jgi:hypothetical protein
MRPDQREKLEALSERLADVFITEADPDNWTADGVLPRDMTQQERGDRHWDRKGAMGTGGVLKYTIDLIASGEEKRIDDDAEQAARDADLDKRIKDAEKRASAAVARVLNKAKGKPEYDRRTHGNAER